MNCEIETLEVKPNDVIVAKFDIEKIPVDEIANFMSLLKANFPNHKIIGIPNDGIIIKAEDVESVIKYLQEVAENEHLF